LHGKSSKYFKHFRTVFLKWALMTFRRRVKVQLRTLLPWNIQNVKRGFFIPSKEET
jgi:hypothetical protein